MTLSEYLRRNNLTATAFASKIKRSISTVTRIAKGEIMPDYETVRAIFLATGGNVEPASFYDLPALNKKTNKKRA